MLEVLRLDMGTLDDPDNIPHWSNQAMFFNKLENFRKKQKGFWLMFSQCCGQCGGREFLENILTDVTAVRQGGKSGDYTPDILLERGDKAPIWLEFTQPEPPSVQKLAYCAAHGIDGFELDGGQRPVDSVVIKAHIAPRNCRDRKRKRLMNIWENMRRTEHPVISIREDMRSPERKQREFEARWAEMEAEREAVAAGDVHCARCDKVFTLMEGSGMSLSYLTIHQPEGQCGAVPFCDDCFFQVMGGHDRTFPEDAARWGLNNDCPKCQDFLAQEESYAGPKRESVEMPAPYGVRWVGEPEKRVREYRVGDRTVNREELLAVVMMFKWYIGRMGGLHPEGHLPRTIYLFSRKLDETVNAVMFTNNILDWDWREGVGDSYIPDVEAQGYDKEDRHVPLKAFMEEIPPCPIPII